MTLEEENDRLRASLSQAIATIELLLLAVELPEERRHGTIERAKVLAEEAKTILNIGRPVTVEPAQ